MNSSYSHFLPLTLYGGEYISRHPSTLQTTAKAPQGLRNVSRRECSNMLLTSVVRVDGMVRRRGKWPKQDLVNTGFTYTSRWCAQKKVHLEPWMTSYGERPLFRNYPQELEGILCIHYAVGSRQACTSTGRRSGFPYSVDLRRSTRCPSEAPLHLSRSCNLSILFSL